MSSVVEATELYALKWGNHNTFLTQRLYEQCRVSAVSLDYLYTCYWIILCLKCSELGKNLPFEI